MFPVKLRTAVLSSVCEAINALRTDVMIADEDLNITSMNASMQAMMCEAEDDLWRDLKGFSAANLLGRNIDLFHKTPLHQRKMLASLEHPHHATIRIGACAFDLLVTPLKEGNRSVGFAVEWADAKERLLNVEYAGQIAAINRSQAAVTL